MGMLDGALDKEQWATLPLVANTLASAIMAKYPNHGVSKLVETQTGVAEANMINAKQEMMQKEAEEKKKKGGIVGGVSAALGGVAGFAVGGPVGAAAGAQAGAGVGSGVSSGDYGAAVSSAASGLSGVASAKSADIGPPAHGYTAETWAKMTPEERARATQYPS